MCVPNPMGPLQQFYPNTERELHLGYYVRTNTHPCGTHPLKLCPHYLFIIIVTESHQELQMRLFKNLA